VCLGELLGSSDPSEKPATTTGLGSGCAAAIARSTTAAKPSASAWATPASMLSNIRPA
jgi:hypothetical protein